jgi:hypothetical protein
MDALELLRRQTERAYDWLEITIGDITPEMAGWTPPGTANSIAHNYAHAVMWADVDINRYFLGREPLLAGEWEKRLGCDAADPDEKQIARNASWADLRAYGQTVQQWISKLLRELPPAELDRKFQMVPEFLGVWTGLDILDLHGQHHIRMHGGEIACLKGLQGGKGYRGGADSTEDFMATLLSQRG